MRNSRAAAIALIILSLFMAFPACKAPETADTSTISVSAAASKTIAAEGSVDITLCEPLHPSLMRRGWSFRLRRRTLPCLIRGMKV